jgi:NAD(P)-dependent dehydrogenase (short-subunit alcohol dehydrogenase family)
VIDSKNPFDLAGRVCVVTGGGSGIGQGVALAFAGQGASVAILDRNDAGLEETLGLITKAGGKGLALNCDVSNPASVEAARASVCAHFGDAQVLVNSAGISRRGAMESLPLEYWNEVIAVNLTGYFLCSQTFGRAMLDKRDGVLVHLASIMSDYPNPYSGAYSVTKAGVRMLSRQLAIEWGSYGVRSNCVTPSLVITPMSQATYDLPGVMERRCAAVPMGRIGLPEDMANAALYLVSPLASYVNGTELVVDGGVMSNLMSLVPRPAPPARK